jgi:hypothetical protein
VVARRNFRYDASVNGMQVDLAVQGVSEQAMLRGIERDAGLVATGFDAENVHGGE